MGVIEVKTRLDAAKLRQSIQKLSDLRESVYFRGQPFTGLFSFEHEGEDFQTLLNDIKTAAAGSSRRVVSWISLGTSLFARYWWAAPERPNRQADIVRAYRLKDLAPAYFVHNVIEALCNESVVKIATFGIPPGKRVFYPWRDFTQRRSSALGAISL